MTVLIDSWTWIEYWRGGPQSRQAAEHIDGDDAALASAINLAEVYYWFLRQYDRKVADERREAIERRCLVASLDADLAVEATLLRKDEHLSLADSIILATAHRFGASMVTGDPDLRGKRGVVFIGA